MLCLRCNYGVPRFQLSLRGCIPTYAMLTQMCFFVAGDYKELMLPGEWPPIRFYQLPQMNVGVMFARSSDHMVAAFDRINHIMRSHGTWYGKL